MAVNAIPVDQRVIDIDSRRFASIEKALVELITNSDDSYTRLERAGQRVSGRMRVQYERHRHGALLTVADEAEGLAFDKACAILSYGGAHSLLAQGMAGGRGYFGRGLKQAIFGLGSGWLETIHDGRLARIELFRGEDGAYLYDDGGHDRGATAADRERLGIPGNGTRVAIVVDSPQASISQFGALAHALARNIYLRDVLARRHVEVAHLKDGVEVERSARVQFEEPPSVVLLGPELPGQFQYEHQSWPFTLTLKRALEAELTPRGDERTSGLLVLSGTAVLDCQFFDYENQVGTEYLFGTVRCPALVEKLAAGEAVISDERAQRLFKVHVDDNTRWLDAADSEQLSLGLGLNGNKGFEGLAYDSQGRRLFVAKERDPLRILEITGFPGDEQRLNLQVTDDQRRDRGLFVRDLSSLQFDERSGHLLALSDESRLVIELDIDGRPISTLSLLRGMHGLKRSVPQAEGLAMDEQGTLYLVSEPNLFYVFAKQAP